ncbi:MAG: ABC transporter permease [Bacteroidota bacterium]
MDKEPIPAVRVNANGQTSLYWKELWQYRDLLYILSWRDLKVRYKQTLLGAAWAIIRPLLSMLIFTFIFGQVAGLDKDATVAYPLLVMAGVLAWQLTASSISGGAAALVANERLLTKVYFPRVIIPLSALATCLLDFLIAFSLQLLLFGYYSQWPAWSIVLLPFWVMINLFFTLGLGLGLGAMNVRYRDFRYALPFILQLGMFLSPVGFSTRSIPERWQWLYELNPVVGLIESFRWCLLEGTLDQFPTHSFLITVVWSLVIFILGFRYFRKMENTLADII